MPRSSRTVRNCCAWASLLLLGAACATLPPMAVGPLREVTVVSPYWVEIKPVVESLFGRKVPTPQPEPEFRLRVGSEEKFDAYSKFRLLLLVGTSRDSLLRQILGKRVDSLPYGDYGLFKVPNAWVRNQTVVIFVARDERLVKPGIALYGPRLRHTVREVVLGQAAKAAYLRGFEKRLTDSLSNRFSFSVDIPKGWVLNDVAAGEQFVYAFGHFPDRGVFAYWRDSIGPLEPDSVLALRDWLTGRYYRGDSVDRDFTTTEAVEFLGTPALRVEGVWQNDSITAGGPFVTYAFNFQGRYYLLDGYVFNPGKKKLDQVSQVEAVVRTFVPR